MFPGKKKLSNLMIYTTDLCDSACKHCLIWTKRPVKHLPKEKIFEIISNNKCVSKRTKIGLEGGEFLLHPQAFEILEWMVSHHSNFDLLSNCLKPDKLIEAVKMFPPKRLWISLDGTEETYLNMRGKDGYRNVLKVIQDLRQIVPISVMFTLSPYNDFTDLEHVAGLCKKYEIDLRIGIYNNISFFDTIDSAHFNEIGSLKGKEIVNIKKAKEQVANSSGHQPERPKDSFKNIKDNLPETVKEFAENYDFLLLYDEWRQGNLKLNCYSILDSLVILPNGDVPICQNLNVMTGNIFTNTLDEIFNSPESVKRQKHYVSNCNACWINFHRKYDVVLYRNFERFFGPHVTSKMLGYYWWEKQSKKSYKKLIYS